MAVWAGIDEAGYGPLLGPLVVAQTGFALPDRPGEGILWELLDDAVGRQARTADGRLLVDDSKSVYSGSRGLRKLEESPLSFLAVRGRMPASAGELADELLPPQAAPTDGSPWFEGVGEIALPLRSNVPAVSSKAAVLNQCMERSGIRFLGASACLVLPREYNQIVARTRNKSLLLWQKCGLLLQQAWRWSEQTQVFVLVDRHGGRKHYRKLLCDAFPGCSCDIKKETKAASVYRLSRASRQMWVAFKENGDCRAFPTALASMFAKYLREIYMIRFNSYWQNRIPGLKPTAGYARDARRFLEDIEEELTDEERDGGLVRGR